VVQSETRMGGGFIVEVGGLEDYLLNTYGVVIVSIRVIRSGVDLWKLVNNAKAVA
jgi:hypothetical protein